MSLTDAEPRVGEPQEPDQRWREAGRQIMSGGWAVSAGAAFLAVIAGSIMIAFTDPQVQESLPYFFDQPGDTFRAVLDAVGTAYSALFQGAVYDFHADNFADAIRPLTKTLNFATPLIAAGLGVAVAFRSGLFNIGGQGQLLASAAGAGWIAFAVDLPPVIHLVVALVVGILCGAVWAGIAGLLKARTGAHEVIVTIMLNYIAVGLVAYLLSTKGLLQAPGTDNPLAPPPDLDAQLPRLLGSDFALNLGFVLALLAVVGVWWLLNRSAAGFAFRAVGENPHAAKVAGVDVSRVTVSAMLIAGGLVGLAGVTQVLAAGSTGFGPNVDAGIGFDAITVALLGSSTPVGVLFAGILFGGFKAGGTAMKASEDIPAEIVLVVQSLIVLFIAAPPLVRAIFRLPQPRKQRSRTRARRLATQPDAGSADGADLTDATGTTSGAETASGSPGPASDDGKQDPR